MRERGSQSREEKVNVTLILSQAKHASHFLNLCFFFVFFPCPEKACKYLSSSVCAHFFLSGEWDVPASVFTFQVCVLNGLLLT